VLSTSLSSKNGLPIGFSGGKELVFLSKIVAECFSVSAEIRYIVLRYKNL
jgi:hypothetical protein